MEPPRRPSDPRPDNRPYFINPNCDICGTQLVLVDIYDNPDNPPKVIWYDEWVCPNHREEGVYMDWPQEQVDELNRRKDEADESLDVELADYRNEGGFKIMLTPGAVQDLLGNDAPIEEILEVFRKMKQSDN